MRQRMGRRKEVDIMPTEQPTEPNSSSAYRTSGSPLPEARQMTLRDDLKHCGCGFLMGAADIVPGVSGGTMALIVGIYERLVSAISHIDREFLQHVLSRRFRQAAEHADLRFLVGLGCGILLGAGGLASVMKVLLTDHRTLTYAAFTGMILASSLLVARQVRLWSMLHVGLLLLAAAGAWWLVTLSTLQNPPNSLVYLFFCGMIGISAMILPGISGAFILLLLSRYETVLNAIRSFVHLELSVEVITTLVVFSLGCLTGLLAFSRVLKKLLTTYHDSTIAVLCGFMLGSLYRLWPFQKDLTPDVRELKHKLFEHIWPANLTNEVWQAAFTAVIAGALVLTLDTVGRRMSSTTR
jgi:putative membrane protein